MTPVGSRRALAALEAGGERTAMIVCGAQDRRCRQKCGEILDTPGGALLHAWQVLPRHKETIDTAGLPADRYSEDDVERIVQERTGDERFTLDRGFVDRRAERGVEVVDLVLTDDWHPQALVGCSKHGQRTLDRAKVATAIRRGDKTLYAVEVAAG